MDWCFLYRIKYKILNTHPKHLSIGFSLLPLSFYDYKWTSVSLQIY